MAETGAAHAQAQLARARLGDRDLADLGGLCIAYDALQRALAGRATAPIDGFTPEQRFFIAWARQWRCNYTPARLKLQVNTNPHAPANFRAIGGPSDMSSFAAAFACKPGDAMVRDGAERRRRGAPLAT